MWLFWLFLNIKRIILAGIIPNGSEKVGFIETIEGWLAVDIWTLTNLCQYLFMGTHPMLGAQWNLIANSLAKFVIQKAVAAVCWARVSLIILVRENQNDKCLPRGLLRMMILNVVNQNDICRPKVWSCVVIALCDFWSNKCLVRVCVSQQQHIVSQAK